MTSAWSSGTGMAGVGGALAYLLLFSVMKLSNSTVFLLLAPLNLVYMFAFVWITRSRSQTMDEKLEPLSPIKESKELTNLQDPDVFGYESSFLRFFRVFGYVASIALQMAAVYFFEYVVCYGFGSRIANYEKDSTQWAYSHAYEILCFLYQIGVLISRSSLSVIQIKKLWILTTLRGCNFLVWFYMALNPQSILPIGILFAHMVFIGLLGGASYVNSFALLMNTRTIPEQDREFAINIVAIFITLGTVGSALFELIADNTFLLKH